MADEIKFHGTTILSVRDSKSVVVAGDGQVSLGNTIMKHGAHKVRRIYKDSVLVGFAGGGADALALAERFEAKLEQFSGNLKKAVVELAKDWRMDKMLRQLEAFMIVSGTEGSFLLSGSGEVIEPDDGIIAIGSGGFYALAAARALSANTKLGAREIAEKSLTIAADICVFTNHEITIEEIKL